MNEGYLWLCGSHDNIRWQHWIWNENNNIPKHSFILWLAALGKLKTREKLGQVGISHDLSCLLYR